MKTYADLEVNHFYLIIEKKDEPIELVQPLLATNECIFLEQYDDLELNYWRKKSDLIFEVVEELTEEQISEYDELFEEGDEEED